MKQIWDQVSYSDHGIHMPQSNFTSFFPFGKLRSIRSRLVMLVLISVLPALSIILYTGYEERLANEHYARLDVLRAVEDVSRTQDALTAVTHQLLVTIAQYPEVKKGEQHNCNKLLGILSNHSPFNSNLFIVRPDGTVLASGNGTVDLDVSAHDYIRKAKVSNDFVIGEFIYSHSNDSSLLPFAYPIHNDQGDFRGIVVIGLRLDQYGNLLDEIGFPEGSIVGIDDRYGKRLCRFPQTTAMAKQLGQPLPDRIWKIISQEATSGTFWEKGVDGIRRIYGYRQLSLQRGEAPYLYVRVGIPEKIVFAKAEQRLHNNIMMLFLATGCALALAWYLGNITFVFPIKKIIQASEKLRAGDLSVRSGFTPLAVNDEIGGLGQSFDSLAQTLQEREAERRASQKIVRELANRNEQILNSAGEAIMGIDAGGMVIFANPAASELTKFSPEELLGQGLHAMIHHSHPDGTSYDVKECPMNKTLRLGLSERIDNEVLWRKDGRSFFASYASTPIIEEERIVGAVITFQDITAKREMELLLKKRESEYRNLVENSPDAIARYDLQYRRIYVNPVMERAFGIPADSLLGKRPTDLSVIEEAKKVEEVMRQVVHQGIDVRIEVQNSGQNERFTWGDLRIVPEFGLNGEVASVMLVGRDISAQKKAEEKLRASELQIRKLSDNAPGVLFSLNQKPDGTSFISYISHQIEDLSGLQPTDMVSDLSKFYFAIHPDDRKKVLSAFDDSANNLSQVRVEFRFYHAVKGEIWIESRATPESKEDKELLWYGFLYDITKNKKLEKELFLARKLEIIGQLAGGVAHEVRNPLNAILSLTEALFTEDGIAGNQVYYPYIERIRTQVTRLSKLMSDLLYLGRPIKKAGFQILELESICKLAVKAWTSDNTRKARTISIVSEHTASVPLVTVDPFQFNQVLLNLFDNAAQCSPIATEIVLKISDPGGGMVRLEVKDLGTGIPSEKLDRIFEPFFTLSKGGTGLGLTLVKHLVEGFGGEISIQNNEPPPGCSVAILIPSAERDERVH